MKRTQLERRTPLRSHNRTSTYERPPAPPMDLDAAARALANQAASAAAPARDYQPVPDVSQPTARPKNTGFPPATREVILGRDNLQCQSCGRPADGDKGYSLQHRDNRGMGGTRDPRINLPSNGVTLCGSATTPGGCHEWAENNEREAARLGYVVRSWAEPSSVPVKTIRGWMILGDNGRSWLTREPPNGDAHAVAVAKAKL